MGKYAILTDSASHFEQEEIKDTNIFMIPLSINIEEKSYKDRVEITSSKIVEAMEKHQIKTSMPVVGEFIKIVDEIKSKGYKGIIGMPVPAQLSGSFKIMEEILKLSGLEYAMVDTLSVSLPMGYLVLEGSRLLNEGKSIQETKKILEHRRNEVTFFAGIENLDYLIRGGRLSKIAGNFGKALKIIPIVNLDHEGKVTIVEKTRGTKQALTKLVQNTIDFIGDREYILFFAYGRDESQILDLKERAAELIKNAKSVETRQLPAIILAHSGPEVSAIGVYLLDK